MGNRAPFFVVAATVLLAHIVFTTATFHVSDVKILIFAAGLFVLMGMVAWKLLFGLESLSPLFEGIPARHVTFALIAYLVLAACSILWASFRAAAVFRTVELLFYVTWTLLVILSLKSPRDLSRLMWVFFATGVLMALTAFVCAAIPASMFDVHREQFFLPAGNANWLAVGLLIPMMFCVEGFARNVRLGRAGWVQCVLFALAFALMASAMYFSGSESAAAAFLIALIALPIFTGARRRWLIAAVVVGAIALGCAADLAFGKPGKIRSFAQNKSVAIRLDLWRWGVELAERNPVSGLGAGAYFPSINEVSARDLDRHPGYYGDIVVHAHNEPLEVIAELGALGLLAWLWPLATVFRGVSRLPRDGLDPALRARIGAFAAGLLAVFLQSFLDVGMRFDTVPLTYWTGVAFLAASMRIVGAGQAAPSEAAVRKSPAPGAIAAFAALALALAAGTWFIIVDGLRGAVAMKQADLKTTSPSERLRLLRVAATDQVSFVDRVRSRNALGRLYAGEGKPAAAGDQFLSVVTLAGHYHDTELLLALTYLDRNMPGDAMKYIESYGNLRPADPRTANFLAAYLRRLPAEEASKEIAEMVRTHPECSKVCLAIGKIALQLDPPDTAAALRSFQKAYELNPFDAHAVFLLGIEKLKHGDRNGARAFIGSAHDMGLRLPELYVQLVALERGSREDRRADELLKEGLKLFPDSPEIIRMQHELPKAGS